MDRIATYYNSKNENQRLSSGRGELEFLRTKQIIEQFLPDETGLSIVDVGGGIETVDVRTRYFTDAYFHHPDEIEQEAEEAHLQIVDHIAVEGVAWVEVVLNRRRQKPSVNADVRAGDETAGRV